MVHAKQLSKCTLAHRTAVRTSRFTKSAIKSLRKYQMCSLPGASWGFLGILGAFVGYLRLSEPSWCHLELPGASWNSFGAFWRFPRPLGFPGASWALLGTSGVTRGFLWASWVGWVRNQLFAFSLRSCSKFCILELKISILAAVPL